MGKLVFHNHAKAGLYTTQTQENWALHKHKHGKPTLHKHGKTGIYTNMRKLGFAQKR